MNENLANEDLIRVGFEILIRELGIARAVRFMQQLHPGQGDYTAERHQWLPNDLDEVLETLARKAASNRPTVGASAIGPFEIAAGETPSAD